MMHESYSYHAETSNDETQDHIDQTEAPAATSIRLPSANNLGTTTGESGNQQRERPSYVVKRLSCSSRAFGVQITLSHFASRFWPLRAKRLHLGKLPSAELDLSQAGTAFRQGQSTSNVLGKLADNLLHLSPLTSHAPSVRSVLYVRGP